MTIEGTRLRQPNQGDTTWMADAACLGADPDLFFPERGGSTSEAKAVCHTCPVMAACLEYALVNMEKHGVWGGTSERERRQIRSRQRKPRAA